MLSCIFENDVIIGDNVTIGVQIWDGIDIRDDVFIGPNVSFCNDKYPVSKKKRNDFGKIVINKGSSIGAGVVILPGIKIGQNSLIGAGTILTKSIGDNLKVRGNPLKIEKR